MRGLLLALLSWSVCACASPARAPLASSLDEPLKRERPAPEPPQPVVPDDVVARAAQPFHAQQNSDGRELNQTELLNQLSKFDVLCLGEAHNAARDHFAELFITEGVAERAKYAGRSLGIGFEMFQAPYEQALQLYALGRVDDAGLRKRTHYDDRWGFPFAYYQPILAFGRDRGLPLKALNAPSELTHAVAEKGLSGLSSKERRQLPDLDLDDAAHRAEFERLMAGHPHTEGMDLDNFYAAQVVWDESMADNAASWVAAQAPSRQLLILAGSAHCRRQAIPARIERREAVRVSNVRLSTNSAEDSAGYDYTLLFDAG